VKAPGVKHRGTSAFVGMFPSVRFPPPPSVPRPDAPRLGCACATSADDRTTARRACQASETDLPSHGAWRETKPAARQQSASQRASDHAVVPVFAPYHSLRMLSTGQESLLLHDQGDRSDMGAGGCQRQPELSGESGGGAERVIHRGGLLPAGQGGRRLHGGPRGGVVQLPTRRPVRCRRMLAQADLKHHALQASAASAFISCQVEGAVLSASTQTYRAAKALLVPHNAECCRRSGGTRRRRSRRPRHACEPGTRRTRRQTPRSRSSQP